MADNHHEPRTDIALIPRLIRFRDAPRYLGMDRNRFNTEVRPQLTEIPIGKQGIAFDRLEMDRWADQYVAVNGRPAQKEGLWLESRPASSSGAKLGGSTRLSTGSAFEKALAAVTGQKRNAT